MTKSSGMPLFRPEVTLIRPCLGAACSQLAVGRSRAALSGTMFLYKMLDAFRLRKHSYGALLEHSAPTEMALS